MHAGDRARYGHRHHRAERRRQVDAVQRAGGADRARLGRHRFRRPQPRSACARTSARARDSCARSRSRASCAGSPCSRTCCSRAPARAATRPGAASRRRDGCAPSRQRRSRARGSCSNRWTCGRWRTSPRGNLSGGQKKLLEISRALMQEPEIILLDEPAAGVSPLMTKVLGDTILRLRAQGITFAIIEHDMDVIAELCEPIYVLAEGRTLTSRHLPRSGVQPGSHAGVPGQGRMSRGAVGRRAARRLRRRRHPERHRRIAGRRPRRSPSSGRTARASRRW